MYWPGGDDAATNMGAIEEGFADLARVIDKWMSNPQQAWIKQTKSKEMKGTA